MKGFDIKMDLGALKRLEKAQIQALEMAAEALHEDVKDAQVIPFAATTFKEEHTYGKRGQFAKNGREYKGKVKKVVDHSGGQLNENTFADLSNVNTGEALLVSSTPYARRMYFHPEYNFYQGEHNNARGKWYEDWLPGGSKEDFAPKAYAAHYKRLTGV